MAAKFEEKLGATTWLIEGSGGVFDVQVDEALVYSKHETGDFPDEDQLIEEVASG